MTRPMVSSRIVGAPDDRKSALSGVMSGIRKPKPMTIPASSMAWMTKMSGSIAPIAASDQRIRVPKLVQRRTWTGAIGVLRGAGEGAAVVDSDMGGLLRSRVAVLVRCGILIGVCCEGDVGVLECRRGQREPLDPSVAVLDGGPRDGGRSLGRRDGEQCASPSTHPAPDPEPRVRLGRILLGRVPTVGRNLQLQTQIAVLSSAQARR